MRAFFMRGNFKPCQSVLCATKNSAKRVFLRASKIWRWFLSRAIQNVGEKKASKTFNFQFEKSEGKKNLCTLIHLLTQLTKTRFFSLQTCYVDNSFLFETAKKIVQTPRAHQGYSFYQYVLHLSQRPQRGNLAQRDPTGPTDPAGKITKINRTGKNSQN